MSRGRGRRRLRDLVTDGDEHPHRSRRCDRNGHSSIHSRRLFAFPVPQRISGVSLSCSHAGHVRDYGVAVLGALPLAIGLAFYAIKANRAKKSCNADHHAENPWQGEEVGRGKGSRWREEVGFAVIVLVVTCVLFVMNVPMRLAFLASRSAFESKLAERINEDPYPMRTQARRLGIYPVDCTSAHPQGGVYFRTNWQASGPDTLSFGFAYKPNPNGSPFGRHYSQSHLIGDWYVFSDDDD
jgi:hypothetical protein